MDTTVLVCPSRGRHCPVLPATPNYSLTDPSYGIFWSIGSEKFTKMLRMSEVKCPAAAILAGMRPEIIYNEWRISLAELSGQNILEKCWLLIKSDTCSPPDLDPTLCSVPGFSLLTSGQPRKRKGAAENIPESFPDGEHDPSPNEPQLLPNGKLLSSATRLCSLC